MDNKLNATLFFQTLFKILGNKYGVEIELTSLEKKLPDGSVVEVYNRKKILLNMKLKESKLPFF